ncbi:hypothetical protein MNB_SV-8-24 [hydrothermal vent metagenome]|uniref:Uncharacterized protein n=1 Tax=hydrothermal vent metagenome TaxID=652676 RepID=A0A1W1BI89_9ZZZZ
MARQKISANKNAGNMVNTCFVQTEVVIVTYSQGIEALLKQGDRDIRKRVEALYDL